MFCCGEPAHSSPQRFKTPQVQTSPNTEGGGRTRPLTPKRKGARKCSVLWTAKGPDASPKLLKNV